MKLPRLVIYILLLIASQPSISVAVDIPSSSRSRNVIARVKPAIEKELENSGLRFSAPIYIRIFKESGELELWLENGHKYKLFKTYKICYFSGTLGPKLMVGDHQSPEGFYFVKPQQLNPSSQFHLSFNLGYPNAYDRSHNRTGSALMVHGDCVSIGCYAMTDKNIEEIYTLADASLRNGQSFFRVHIFPFRMTAENMNKYTKSTWYSFWKNLKEGYDLFEAAKRPPNVLVRNKRYVFENT